MKENKRPLILISNDDGIDANGVYALIDFVAELGDIVCVCPDGPRSGQSMAITVNSALRISQLPDYNGAKMYKVNGSPVDCVKLAVYVLNQKPDLVLSGINHGSNAAINVVYSGTMGATFEGCAFGIPSIGFSLTDHNPQANMLPCKPFVQKITKAVLENGLPADICLNVNIPNSEIPPTKMRVVRACKGNWSDEYQPYVDPSGKPFYLLTGKFTNEEPEATDTDEYCLANGIVSIVPVKLDRTAPISTELQYLKKLE